MNQNPNPTARFLVGSIANLLRIFLTPFYYAGRSDMGVQHCALASLMFSAAMYACIWTFLSITSPINARVAVLYNVLVVLGYIRNADQAKRRRRARDWNVNSWSSGKSLLEPVLVSVCRRLYRKYGKTRRILWLIRAVLDPDFIYYSAEPAVLVIAALALASIGSTLFPYPLLLAVSLIFHRHDAKLLLYLRAHEIADGKMVERAIMREYQGDGAKNGSGDIRVAQIPAAPTNRAATDRQSVFDRLSPELQLLLVRDQATHR
jgi:hypothetical protein